MTTHLPRIMALVDHYLPGYKLGGPVRTVANMVDQLSDHFSFWIVTKDRDWLDSDPYHGISVGAWNRVGKAMVYYGPTGVLTHGTLKRLIQDVRPSAVYLNSFFATNSVNFLFWRRVRMLPKLPVVLAPRGQLSPGALRLKWLKKRLYRALATRLGLLNDLIWQASSPLEANEIHTCLGVGTHVHVAPNLPRADYGAIPVAAADRPPKYPDSVRLVFLSRISPKKNLQFALKVLGELRGDVIFDIYGPVDSEPYWQACRRTIRSLPKNVLVEYRGSIVNEQAVEMLSTYHFMILPTLSENFGHVIFESLSAGCPLLISDQTPWQGLSDQGLGWDTSLDDLGRWQYILQECIKMDDVRHRAMSEACLRFAGEWAFSSGAVAKNIALFQRVCEGLFG